MNRNGGAAKAHLRAKCAIQGGLGACPPEKILKFKVFLVHSGAILVLMN